MLINFENNQVNDISFYTSPEARFIPPHELDEPESRLKDFKWRIEEKPEKENVITGIKPFIDDPILDGPVGKPRATIRTDPE